MENYRFTLPLLPTPGKLTTVYAVDGGTARNAVLTTMATLLAERAGAGVPVLMIDWDTEAPGLHEEFDRGRSPSGHSRPGHSRPGLLEYALACREQLALLRGEPGHDSWREDDQGRADADDSDGEAAELRRARQVFEAVDWEPFVERVDDSRPLYLMRAGCFDDSYGERAAGADWEGLFNASPSLYRCFAEHFSRRFAHVLVASRGGRSAAVSVCTSLLADRLVALFSPSQRSLDGVCGVVRRAIDYRASHEAAQRPLLVYPLPVDLDGADHGRRLQWRHGDSGSDGGAYQAVLEQLMRDSYALADVCLDDYFDHVQLQQLNAQASHLAGASVPRLPLTADRFSLARGVAELLEWVAEGNFPWQARAELAVSRRIAGARAADPDGVSPAFQTGLAADLFELGRLQQRQGRARQALASVFEAATLQSALWGAGHADTRAGRLALGSQLLDCGKADSALSLYRCLFDEYAQALGHTDAATLCARAGLAAGLAACGQFDAALGHAEQVVIGWRERCGLNHRATLAAQAAHADVLARAGDFGRARMLLEQVLEGRERVLGAEHADTLDTVSMLAVMLRQMGHLDTARGLQEQVLASRRRLLGSDHADAIEAGLALADTLAAQCDLQRMADIHAPLTAACQRRYGRSMPPGSREHLLLASALVRDGGLAPAAVPPSQHAQQSPSAPPSPPASAPPAVWRVAPPPALPHESGVAFCHGASAGHAAGAPLPVGARHADPCEIERSVIRLEQMEDRAADEARELADRLREPVLTANVAPLVRARGVRAIVDVYFHQGDTDALVAFMQEQSTAPSR